MPDSKRVIAAVQRAAQLFRATRGRNGLVIDLDAEAQDVLVAGDLHGNLAHFQALLDRARLDRHPRRHLVLQEVVHGESRYSDGGCKSHQLVDLVSALKCQYPDRVHLVLGNHELAELLDRSIIKGGVRSNEMFRQGIQQAYGAAANQILTAYRELFRSLPLAVRTHNGVFISHSFPEKSNLDDSFDPLIFQARSIAEISPDRARSLHDIVWGRDSDAPTARQFAALVGAQFLVTGHMPCSEGFRNPNPLQLIVDCSRFPACYCLFSNQHPLTIDELVSNVQSL